jgi:hypothetical protein
MEWSNGFRVWMQLLFGNAFTLHNNTQSIFTFELPSCLTAEEVSPFSSYGPNNAP